MNKKISLTRPFLAVMMTFFMIVLTSLTSLAASYSEFHNVANNTPDLYVKKSVFSAVEDVPIPDTNFNFQIKVGGKIFANKEYEVYDASGTQVLNYAEVNGSRVEIPFETDRNGYFILKGGQTAKFPFLGKGATYEVTEEITDNHWVQTSPAGNAPASGTVDAKGSAATFINTYYPETSADLCEFQIEKTMLIPVGYEVYGSPDFTFQLMISGAPYANQTYTVGEESGITNSNGEFTLKAGQKAVFSGVETGLDYEVKELSMPDGWRQIDITGSTGATKAPITYVSATNTQASFAVSKRMEGYSTPDVDFTFNLKLAGEAKEASYYLYDTYHELVDDTVHTTDTSGQFTLKAGQTALFVGIAPGTTYDVTETATSGYIQTLPESGGYSGIVNENDITINEFVNAIKGTSELIIAKANEEGDPLQGVKFVVKKGEGGIFTQSAKFEQEGDPSLNTWKFVGWGLTGTELTTDESGNFTLTRLEDGIYCLTETEALSGYLNMKDIVFEIRTETSIDGVPGDITLKPADGVERGDVMLSGSMKDGTGVLHLTNRKAPILPTTGGTGILSIILTSALLCLVGTALIFLVLPRRRQ